MKILHTADIHLGYETHGKLDPQTGLNTRLLDFQRSFRFMVETAIREAVDVFLFCGDAYKTPDPTPTHQKLFAECLMPLHEAGIPVVMITGNHDIPVSHGKASALDIFPFLRGKAHVYTIPEAVTLPTRSGPLQLIALPWPVRSKLLSRETFRTYSPAEINEVIVQKYLDFIDAALAEFKPDLPTVLAGHFTVQGSQLSGSERSSVIAYEPVFTIGQLARPEIDYVALGHIHKFQDLNPGGHPPVVYASSIERVSFKEADQPKGFVLVEIASEGFSKSTHYRFIPTPARRFISLTVDLRGVDNTMETLLHTIRAADVTDAVVRIRYQIEEERFSEVDLPTLRQALAPAHKVAGIERVVEPHVREQRTRIQKEDSIEEALIHYLEQHEDLQPLKDELLNLTRRLKEELD